MLTKSLVLMITDSLALVWAESASDPFTGTWKAKGARREFYRHWPKTGYVSAVNTVTVYAGLGDADATFEWLQKGR
jgi:hypothetical protein